MHPALMLRLRTECGRALSGRTEVRSTIADWHPPRAEDPAARLRLEMKILGVPATVRYVLHRVTPANFERVCWMPGGPRRPWPSVPPAGTWGHELWEETEPLRALIDEVTSDRDLMVRVAHHEVLCTIADGVLELELRVLDCLWDSVGVPHTLEELLEPAVRRLPERLRPWWAEILTDNVTRDMFGENFHTLASETIGGPLGELLDAVNREEITHSDLRLPGQK